MPPRNIQIVSTPGEIVTFPNAAGVGVIGDVPYVRGASGLLAPMAPDFFAIRQATFVYTAGLLAGATYGLMGIGDVGSSTAGTVSRSPQADNMYVDYLSAAAAGSQAYNRSGTFGLFQSRHGIDFQTIVRSSDDLTNIRTWVGLFSSAPTDSDTITGHGAAFRFSSVAGDAGWRPITRDNATQTVGTAIGTVTAATAYRLRIRLTATAAYFSVNGSTEQVVTTTLPTSTQDLGHQQGITAQAASARNFKIARTVIVFGASVGELS
jgi:hypothetical protein